MKLGEVRLEDRVGSVLVRQKRVAMLLERLPCLSKLGVRLVCTLLRRLDALHAVLAAHFNGEVAVDEVAPLQAARQRAGRRQHDLALAPRHRRWQRLCWRGPPVRRRASYCEVLKFFEIGDMHPSYWRFGNNRIRVVVKLLRHRELQPRPFFPAGV